MIGAVLLVGIVARNGIMLMTTVVMVLGLLPLAIAVIGGILTSTILTLVVLPAATPLIVREKAHTLHEEAA